jgi:NAD+ kinase
VSAPSDLAGVRPSTAAAAVAPAFNPVALIGRHNGGKSADSLTALATFLTGRGCEVLLEKQTAVHTGVTTYRTADYSQLGAEAKLAIVLGGDGSMLNAARHLAQHRVPLIGVNQGRLGFMTDIALGRMIEVVGQVMEGQYSIEDRTMLSAEVVRDGQSIFTTLALNDVVVNKGAVGRLIEGEATVKRYYPEGDVIRFQPANARMEPIYVRRADFRSVDIIGVVVGVYRKMPDGHTRVRS